MLCVRGLQGIEHRLFLQIRGGCRNEALAIRQQRRETCLRIWAIWHKMDIWGKSETVRDKRCIRQWQKTSLERRMCAYVKKQFIVRHTLSKYGLLYILVCFLFRLWTTCLSSPKRIWYFLHNLEHGQCLSMPFYQQNRKKGNHKGTTVYTRINNVKEKQHSRRRCTETFSDILRR